jgi:hypothetical protein
MKNKYGLPVDKLAKIKERDEVCVYCKKIMLEHVVENPRPDWYSIEHLNYLPPWNNPNTVVICCWSCNSSRGNKRLMDWFGSEYCHRHSINIETVSETVRNYIENVESKE